MGLLCPLRFCYLYVKMSNNKKLVDYDSSSSSSGEENVVGQDEMQDDHDNDATPPPAYLDQFFELGDAETRYVKRYSTESLTIPFRFKNMDKLQNVFESLPYIFDRVLSQILEKTPEENMIGIQLDNEKLDKPIIVPFTKKNNLNGLQIVDLIERVLQSNQKVGFDELFEIRVIIVDLPAGSGKRRPISWKNFYGSHACRSGSIIKINSSDDLCLARAVVTAIARINRQNKPNYYDSILRGDKNRHTLQKMEAKRLMREAGLEFHVGPCGIPEVQAIQNVLHGYQIKVISKEYMNALIFKGIVDVKICYLINNNLFKVLKPKIQFTYYIRRIITMLYHQ